MRIDDEFKQRYRGITDKADSLTNALERMHSDHLQCRLGCDYCCMDYSIFPVEFYNILDNIRNLKITANKNAGPSECIFLVNSACVIYGFRPLICRTHGLPLLYLNDRDEWELSACELNFTEFEEAFHAENTFPQDKFNSELFMLNSDFIARTDNIQYQKFDLIPLSKLPDYI